MGQLGDLLSEFNSIWKPSMKDGNHEIIWTLKLNGKSEKENFSLEKLRAFEEYLKNQRYFLNAGDDKIISVSNPQEINVQHNYILYIKSVKEVKQYA